MFLFLFEENSNFSILEHPDLCVCVFIGPFPSFFNHIKQFVQLSLFSLPLFCILTYCFEGNPSLSLFLNYD